MFSSVLLAWSAVVAVSAPACRKSLQPVSPRRISYIAPLHRRNVPGYRVWFCTADIRRSYHYPLCLRRPSLAGYYHNSLLSARRITTWYEYKILLKYSVYYRCGPFDRNPFPEIMLLSINTYNHHVFILVATNYWYKSLASLWDNTPPSYFIMRNVYGTRVR